MPHSFVRRCRSYLHVLILKSYPIFDCLQDDFCSLGPDLAHGWEESFVILSTQEEEKRSQLTDLTRGEAVSPRLTNLRLGGCPPYSTKN